MKFFQEYFRLRRSKQQKKVTKPLKLREAGYFDHLLFVPFKFLWMIAVSMTISVTCITTCYVSFFWGEIYLFTQLEFIYIKNFYSIIIIFAAEIIFLIDLFCLIMHKISTNIRITKPYLPVSSIYLLIGILTIIPSFLNLKAILHDNKNLTWSFIRMFVFARLYRTCMIYNYLMSGGYFSKMVVICFFISVFSILTTVFAVIFILVYWRTIALKHNVPAEKILETVIPMINMTTFKSWQLKSQLDVFLFGHYVMTNTLLGRGGLSFSPSGLLSTLAYQLGMMFTLYMKIFLLAMFAALDIHTRKGNVKFNAVKESLKTKLRYMEISKKTYANVMNWYEVLWDRRKGNINTKMNKLLPAALHQECCLDIFYPSLKHSHIFRDMNLTVLAALSLHMKTEFHCSGDVLYRKGMLRDSMYYVHTGIVQVMSSLDDATPIVSLFPGTCFGESTLLISYPCSIKIVCATYCELKILHKSAFGRALANFPDSYDNIRNRIHRRYKKANLLYAMREIKKRSTNNSSIGLHDDGALKRIKRISREIDRIRHSKLAGRSDQEDKINKMINSAKLKTEYIGASSDYLDMVVISQLADYLGVTFISTNCPIIFHPISPFIKFWRSLVLISVFIMTLLIPYEASLGDQINSTQNMITVFIQVIFIFDLIIECSFAVVTQDKIIDNMTEIFYYRLTTRRYRADIIGSVPLNFLVTFYEDVSGNAWGLLKLNCLARAWRIVEIFDGTITKSYTYRKELLLLCFTFYFGVFICYWSMIFAILSCYNNKCNENSMWIMIEGKNSINETHITRTMKTMLQVMLLCLGEGGFQVQPFTASEHMAVLIMAATFVVLDTYIVGRVCSCEVHAISTSELEKDVVVSVLNFSKKHHLTQTLHYRICRQLKVLQTMKKSHLIFFGDRDVEYLSKDLRKEIKLSAWVNTLLKVPLFMDTDRQFINEVIDLCQCKIFPPNEVIVYSGTFPDYMYIIKKGYCQIISDYGRVEGIKGIGWSFCILELVLNIPIIKTVRTLTSCEAIIIRKSGFLTLLNNFPLRKNELKIIKKQSQQLLDIPVVEGNKLVFQKDITNESFYNFGYDMTVGSKAEKEFLEPFVRISGNFTILRFLLLRIIILPSGKAVWFFEILRTSLALCSCLVFPAKIIFISKSEFYRCLFIFLDVTAYIDIYVRLHVGYYNDRGILVKHPLMTAIHYIKHSFTLDLLGCFPFELIFSELVSVQYAQFWMCYNRLVQIHRVIGFLHHTNDRKVNSKPYALTIKYFIILIVTINVLSSAILLRNCEIDKDINVKFDTYHSKGINCPTLHLQKGLFGIELTPAKAYIVFQYLITSFVAQINVKGTSEWGNNGELKLFICWFGYLITVNIIGHLSGLIFSQNIGITFQRKVKQLTRYLETQRVSKDLKDEFNQFYNTLWEHHQGKNPKENFSILNNTLRCDIFYHVYGKYLRHYTVFGKTKDSSFFRSLLLQFDPLIFHKGCVIVNEGFVNDKIFILNEGFISVFVGKRCVMTLKRGAIFGNLFNSEYTQQLNSFVADTAVELMVLKTDKFFTFIDAYPLHKEMFNSKVSSFVEQGVNVIPGIINNLEDQSPHASKLAGINILQGAFLISKKFKIFRAVIAFLSSVLATYSLAYEEFTIWMVLLNYVLDVTSMIIIIMKCYKPYLNSLGEYETNLSKIRFRYRNKKYGFWIEILTVVPFQTFWFLFKNKKRAYLFLHFNRMTRYVLFWSYLNEVIQKISAKQLTLRIIHLIIHFYTVIYALAALCAIVYLLFDDKASVLTTSYLRFKYFCRMVSVILTGFSHYPHLVSTPCSHPIIIIYRNIQAIIIIIISAIITGYILFFAETFYYNILSYLETEHAILQSLYLQRTGKFLHRTVTTYLRFLWDFNHGTQRPEILAVAPDTLQLKLFKMLYNHHLKNNFIFSNCQQHFIDQILLFLEEELILPGNIIVRKGTKNNTMYFIHKGQVRQYAVDAKGREELQTILLENESFSTKQGLYEQTPHTSTYRAHTTAVILKLNFKSWSHLLNYFPVERHIYNIFKEHNAE